MMDHRGFSRWVALAGVLASGACSSDSSTEPPGGDVNLVVTATVANTAVTTVVVEVSAADIPTPLIFNVPVNAGVASGTLAVPAGSDRTFSMRAYDDGGVQTHSGSITIDVHPGTNGTVTIVLAALAGDVPIDATLGNVGITVNPATANLTVGATQQLAATIVDANGAPLAGPAVWATQNPGIATVDATGLVTAEGVGTTNIVATFGGGAGGASITVTAAP